MYQIWAICDCGPKHWLKEIKFYRQRTKMHVIGMKKTLRMQGYVARHENSWKNMTHCEYIPWKEVEYTKWIIVFKMSGTFLSFKSQTFC